MSVHMKIKGLMVDPVTDMPIVILKNAEEDKVLPIWVGVFEANAIATQLEDAPAPRPMTHDLLKNLVECLGARVERVVISDLRDSTFYAEIHLERQGEQLTVDARPSDAMALALRSDAPIFVEPIVLEKSTSPEQGEADHAERLRRWLETVEPEDLGGYEM